MGGRDSCGRKKQSPRENLGETPRGVLIRGNRTIPFRQFFLSIKEDNDEHICTVQLLRGKFI
jgi:hypothetical protein